MQKYYTVITFLNIFAMIIIQTCLCVSNTLTEERKKVFHKLFNLIIIAAFCEWFGNCLQGSGADTRLLHIVIKAIELSVAPAIPFFVSWIIEKQKEKKIYLYLLLHAILEWTSGIFGFIYYVDKDSNYLHAQFYWIYVAAYIFSIIYCMYTVMRNVKKYQYNGVRYFLLIGIFMLTGIMIQLYDSKLKVDYITIAIVAIMLYVFTLEMIYQTDELTELINRRGFENYSAHIEQKCVILFLDVDSFKAINDTYGHSFGDEVLKIIGKTIRTEYARYGKCFRYGGDEFCVILTKNINYLEGINKKFFDAMAQRREKEKRLPFVAIGYSYYDPQKQSLQDAIEKADQVMYKYKEIHLMEGKRTVR